MEVFHWFLRGFRSLKLNAFACGLPGPHKLCLLARQLCFLPFSPFIPVLGMLNHKEFFHYLFYVPLLFHSAAHTAAFALEHSSCCITASQLSRSSQAQTLFKSLIYHRCFQNTLYLTCIIEYCTPQYHTVAFD